MKKIVPLFLLFFFVATTIKAQDDTPANISKGFFTFAIGPSFPIGDFADSDVGNTDAGFADNGLAINFVNFGYLFSENFGITGMLTGAAFPLDVDNGNQPTWAYGTLLVGPLYSTILGEGKADLDLRFMIGTLTGILDPDDGSEEIDGSAGALSLGAAIRYHLSDKISLATGLDYISSNPEFTVGNNEFKQSIASVNLTFGISFRL